MTTTRNIAIAIAAVLALGAGTADAARPGQAAVKKKLYCWQENGRKVCGDALPPEAQDAARSEISVKSGMHTGEVARALTVEERAALAASRAEAEAEAAVAAARMRRDLAMVESYATEADLRHAYNERIVMLDDAIKASQLSESNLRTSLTSLLSQAGDLELHGRPVSPRMLASLRSQHTELQKQQRILAQQQRDRASLDGELADAVTRYRNLKQPTAAPAPPAGG